MTPPSDISMLKNFHRKTHCRQSQEEQDVKQLYFIIKEMRHPSSPELNSLDHYVWENIRGQSHVSSKTEDDDDEIYV